MSSFIFRHVAQAVLPVAILFAIYLLLRGHDKPGGGFVAGLVTSAAIVLDSLAFGRRRSPIRPPRIQSAISVGLLVAMASGLVATFIGDPFLRHYHIALEFSKLNTQLSTTLLFDIGVYLVVVGSTMTTLATFAREDG